MTRNGKKVYNADMATATASSTLPPPPPPPQAFQSFKAYMGGYAASQNDPSDRVSSKNAIPLDSICELHSPQPRQRKNEGPDQASPSCTHKVIDVLPIDLESDQMRPKQEVFEDEDDVHSVDLDDDDGRMEKTNEGCCYCSQKKIYYGALIAITSTFAVALFIMKLSHHISVQT